MPPPQHAVVSYDVSARHATADLWATTTTTAGERRCVIARRAETTAGAPYFSASSVSFRVYSKRRPGRGGAQYLFRVRSGRSAADGFRPQRICLKKTIRRGLLTGWGNKTKNRGGHTLFYYETAELDVRVAFRFLLLLLLTSLCEK